MYVWDFILYSFHHVRTETSSGEKPFDCFVAVLQVFPETEP